MWRHSHPWLPAAATIRTPLAAAGPHGVGQDRMRRTGRRKLAAADVDYMRPGLHRLQQCAREIKLEQGTGEPPTTSVKMGTIKPRHCGATPRTGPS